jgi:hypothetical protein
VERVSTPRLMSTGSSAVAKKPPSTAATTKKEKKGEDEPKDVVTSGLTRLRRVDGRRRIRIAAGVETSGGAEAAVVGVDGDDIAGEERVAFVTVAVPAHRCGVAAAGSDEGQPGVLDGRRRGEEGESRRGREKRKRTSWSSRSR